MPIVSFCDPSNYHIVVVAMRVKVVLVELSELFDPLFFFSMLHGVWSSKYLCQHHHNDNQAPHNNCQHNFFLGHISVPCNLVVELYGGNVGSEDNKYRHWWWWGTGAIAENVIINTPAEYSEATLFATILGTTMLLYRETNFNYKMEIFSSISNSQSNEISNTVTDKFSIRNTWLLSLPL